MAGLVLRKCPCLRPKMEEEVRVLDYRHSSLHDVPGDVFNFERTLEELYTDSNQIRDLPRELFYCHGLRKLSISDNEITSIPPAIASLDHLEELDFSKNGIIDVPDNIKCCKYLRVIDASVNPLGKLPEGFTQLNNLTHLYLNDTFLDYLPGSFGRLVKLKILEIRENHLKTLPKSFGRLTELERLDIGNNEFTDLPDVIGSLTNLLELWCDHNQITSITHTIGALKQLMFLDASKNQLEWLPGEMEGCTCLADLHLSTNQLQALPDAIGNLSNLTTLKADDNQLTSLPRTLGGLTSLSELNVSVNDLEELPPSIGLLRNLRTFYADENLLEFVPAELGSCSGITVLSLRSNKLTYIPDEIGRIPRLRVINLSDNRLSYLPFTIVKLKELQALWLTENQTRPLIPLQSDYEADTGRKILTCYLLPQGQNSDNDDNGGDGDTDSFHASIWDEERLQRQQIHFNFIDEEDDEGHLVRCPTPYPKEMREKARHMRNLAMRQSMGEGAQAAWSPRPGSSQQENAGSGAYGSSDSPIDVRVREARIAKPQSPSLQETHRLFRYDKEKLLKDKARMQQRQSPTSADDLATLRPRRGKSGDTQPLLQGEGGGSKGKGRRAGGPRLAWNRRDGEDGKRECQEQEGDEEERGLTQLQNGVVSLCHELPPPVQEEGSRSKGKGRRKGGSKVRWKTQEKEEEGEGRDLTQLHNGNRSLAGSDTEDVRVSGRRKSTPNLLNFEDQGSETEVKSTPTLTYEDLYQKQFLQKHHHPHGRRSRRMREYDSDTGYRSDREMQQFQRRFAGDGRDDLSVRSQPTASRHHHRHGRDGGYASDLEAYAGRGRGLAGSQGTSNSAATAFMAPKPAPRPLLQPTHSLPQDLNACAPPPSSFTQPPDQAFSPSPHPQQRQHQPQSLGPGSRPSSGGYQRPGAPPSPSQFANSSAAEPSSPLTPQGFAPPPQSSPGPQGGARGKDKELHRELYTVLEERNKKAAHRPSSTTPSSSRRAPPSGQTPPPYQPAPPYPRPSDQGSDRSDSFSAHDSSRDRGGNSFSNPEYTALQYPGNSRDGRPSDRVQVYETMAVRGGSEDGGESSSGAGQLRRTSRQLDYGEGGARLRYRDSGSSDGRQSSGKDYSVSSYGVYSLASHPSSSRAPTLSDRSSENSSDNLPPANQSQYSQHNLSARQSPHHLDLPAQARSRSGSRDALAEGRRGDGSLTPQKSFEVYPNPYGEPLEAGDPLMSRYEDVAMFKASHDPSSQVSSSTDSGYGHGHHIYERIGDFQHTRQSGSPHSSTPPSHRDPPSRNNSLSQGTPSRETTPVREEGFYSVQGNTLAESSTQESREVFRTVIRKNPGLGFSIAGGLGSRGINPFRTGDTGIFVTKVQPEGPASSVIQAGDKILQVNHIDFRSIGHTQAVNVMKTATNVELLVERIQKINMV